MGPPLPNAQNSRDSSNAPAQLLGYGLQVTRLTAALFGAPRGSVCSVEVLDDVSISGPSGVQAVQTKSSLSGNPVSNRSINLWKTLSIWGRQVSSGRIPGAGTVFEIYISKRVTGEIARIFSEANDGPAAKAALVQAKDLLLNGEKLENLPSDLKKYAGQFFAAEAAVAEDIVRGFRLVCGSGSPQEDLETLLENHPVSESKVVDVVDHMCGWVKREVEKLLEKGESASISRDEFHEKYVSYCQRIDRRTILCSTAPAPSLETSVAEVDQAPMFIQQLALIEAEYDDLLRASSDCYRAAADRAAWAKKGEVDEDSLGELNDNLKRAWTNYKRRGDITHGSLSAVERGRLLWLDCEGHPTNLQGMQVPPHFVPGCFHKLADEVEVGWHPDYSTLLRRDGNR